MKGLPGCQGLFTGTGDPKSREGKSVATYQVEGFCQQEMCFRLGVVQNMLGPWRIHVLDSPGNNGGWFSGRPFVGEIEGTHGIFRSGKHRNLGVFFQIVNLHGFCENNHGHRLLIPMDQFRSRADEHPGGFLLKPPAVTVPQEHPVHIIPFHHLLDNVFIEFQFKEITQIQRVLEMDDVGSQTILDFPQHGLGKGRKFKAIVGAGVGCNDGMPS